MLKKKYRLSTREKLKFETVQNSKFFTLKATKNKLPYNRFRIVVSKKIDKRAVVRNKVKRTVALCLQDLLEKIESGYDMVFFVKKEILLEQKEKICSDVSEVIKNFIK